MTFSKIPFAELASNTVYNEQGVCSILSATKETATELAGAYDKPLIIGVDEAGRGPLLGPVAVSAVILPKNHTLTGLTDSKKLSEKKRLQLFEGIKEQAIAYEVVFVSPEKVDTMNILQATLYGMQQSVLGIQKQLTADVENKVQEVLIDGNKTIAMPYACQAIVGGDALHAEISAASILAKVCRDEYMYWLHEKHPDFGINKHKGYPTKLHKQMIEQHGILAEHRKSFNPIKSMLKNR